MTVYFYFYLCGIADIFFVIISLLIEHIFFVILNHFFLDNEDNNLFLIDGDKISINNSLNDGVSYEFTLEIDGEWDNILNEDQFSVLDLRAFLVF